MTHVVAERMVLLWGAILLLIAAAITVTVGALSGALDPQGSGSIAHCAPVSTASTVVEVGIFNKGGVMIGGGGSTLQMTANPTTAPPGPITFIATNYGDGYHELLIFPMPAEGVVTRYVGGNGKMIESQLLGEVSNSCGAGAGNGIAPGSVGWVTLTLPRGTYELLCDVPRHHTDGMFMKFTVS
ncbi:MAG: hypothetical protein ACP5PJ_10295 [Acidimicrobiales bacterium]